MAQAKMQRGIISVRAETPSHFEIKALIEGLQKSFHDFKAEHSAQLEEAKKGTHDALQALKVDRINAQVAELQKAVDEANIKIAAAEMGGSAGVTGRRVKDREYSAAFAAHMRKGDVQAALNKGTAADGGYLAPTEWDRTIVDRLKIVSPMRAICAVQTISTNGFSKLFNNRGMASGWVGEAAARPETNTPGFGTLTYNTGEIYANPAATQQMLDDAEVDLEAWIAGEVEVEFAHQEGIAFVSGNGTNRPNGLLTYATGQANAAAHPWGAIAVVNSGAAAALTADGIINLVHALPSEYTQNARFIMNRATMGLARLLKDTTNQYLWQPSYQAGQPATLAGHPVTEVAAMPNVAAGARPIVFGDFQRGYLIVDRTGVRVLRDPFTNKPYVHFYTTKRVGGGLLNPDVLKAMNIST
jgi:HK97 family phage major capsid protein